MFWIHCWCLSIPFKLSTHTKWLFRRFRLSCCFEFCYSRPHIINAFHLHKIVMFGTWLHDSLPYKNGCARPFILGSSVFLFWFEVEIRNTPELGENVKYSENRRPLKCSFFRLSLQWRHDANVYFIYGVVPFKYKLMQNQIYLFNKYERI